MASLDYYNGIIYLNELYYESHRQIVERVAIELEAGYRNQVIDLGDEDDDFTADIAISGGYLGLMIKKSF